MAVTVPLHAAWTAKVPALVTAWEPTVNVPSTAAWIALFVVSISPNLVNAESWTPSRVVIKELVAVCNTSNAAKSTTIASNTALSVAERLAVTVPLHAAWTAKVPALVTAWEPTVNVPSTAAWIALFVVSIVSKTLSISVNLVTAESNTALSVAERLAVIVPWTVVVGTEDTWTAKVPALVTAWEPTVNVPSTAAWIALFVVSISPNLVNAESWTPSRVVIKELVAVCNTSNAAKSTTIASNTALSVAERLAVTVPLTTVEGIDETWTAKVPALVTAWEPTVNVPSTAAWIALFVVSIVSNLVCMASPSAAIESSTALSVEESATICSAELLTTIALKFPAATSRP